MILSDGQVPDIIKEEDMNKRAENTPPRPRSRRITFSLRAEPESNVSVSGDFNHWSPEGKPMQDKKGDGLYKTTLYLAPGVYEYKFIVNGIWLVDPECKDWVPNTMGTLNSILRVE